ncbi:KilA-N domain-containing protein [Ralstonia solanacearum]|uniref:KilA-N domain-containing protein n=1 Tax=Ralstonia solanacearum TaxID=305 RepID=A0AAW5ZII3_RALSL|nr:KilA-N domain-containing protein [Ralstonia solanacearum]MDB0569812.1 KilA-N domain-containing protein [Ralstonia solanacearum]
MPTTANKKGRGAATLTTPTTASDHDSRVAVVSHIADALTLDYEGAAVQFTGDGWFNATAVGLKFSKRPADWLRLPETKRYIDALCRRSEVQKSHFTRTRKGRSGSFEQGTWFHPKLAVPFSRWLDVDFAVWADEQIDHILRGGLSLWKKEAGDHSTTNDREPLLTAAAAIVARHRLPFGPVYAALNLFAGVAHAREMTCAQVAEASQFGARLLARTATSEDFARIESNQGALHGVPAQQPLIGGGAA